MKTEIINFIKNARWIFAKSYANTWPHEYTLLRDARNKDVFLVFVREINENGYNGFFYARRQKYYKYSGMLYWTMDETIEKTDLINRCRIEDSYETRLKENRLPPKKATSNL